MDNRLLAFAKLTLTAAQRVLRERAHKFAPKTYTQPQLLACLLLKEYLHLDYRTAQEILDASDRLRRILRLRRAPDYSTLWHFSQEKVTPELIEQALAETVRLLQADSPPPPPGGNASGDPLRCVALDSTGLWTTQASRYFECLEATPPSAVPAGNGAGSSRPPHSGPNRRGSLASASAAVPVATSRT